MIIPVHMLAFHDYTPDQEVIRNVEIPDEEWSNAQDIDAQLGLVYYHGQNCFQAVLERCSVSMGDVAEICGSLFLCCAVGWKPISMRDFLRRVRLDRNERLLADLRPTS